VVSLTRTQLALLLVPLLALLTLAGSRLAGVGANEGPARAEPLVLINGAEPSPARPPLVVVHVVGAVRRPGLFRLVEGSRVAEAVARAGGPTPKAELSAVNLAAPLADGQQVVVPVRGTAAAAVGAGPAAGTKVSLGAATVEQLDELPGIGPVTAQKIVDWRASHGPFRSVEDLDEVPGIGPARIEQLRELVTP
jgi:competence protein ComEA